MGCDIHGNVEVRYSKTSPEFWMRAIDVGSLLDRNYDQFGYLWGVRNYVGFKPLFAQRPLPKNLSSDTQEELEKWDSDAHSKTWASLQELKSIDWTAESEQIDERVHIYRKSETGEVEQTSKASYTWESDTLTPTQRRALAKGERVTTKTGTILAYERTKASEIGHADLDLVIRMMDDLAKRYGEEGVRLIVWFDN